MNLIVAIIFPAVCIGLFVRRVTPRWWLGLACWTILVIAHDYIKH